MNNKVIIVLSGGLDSTILLYHMIYNLGYKKSDIIALSFKLQSKYIFNDDAKNCLYQNNFVELEFAKKTTKKLNIKHEIINLNYLNRVLDIMRHDQRFNSNSKTKNKQETNMPFRNLIMISNALSFAQSYNANKIFLGYQQQDLYGYWDTGLEFMNAVKNIIKLNPDANNIEIRTPFLNYDKAFEISIAQKLNVPLEDTWTCYNPLRKRDSSVFYSCKECKACKERLSNFEKLNIKDPQRYWGE